MKPAYKIELPNGKIKIRKTSCDRITYAIAWFDVKSNKWDACLYAPHNGTPEQNIELYHHIYPFGMAQLANFTQIK